MLELTNNNNNKKEYWTCLEGMSGKVNIAYISTNLD